MTTNVLILKNIVDNHCNQFREKSRILQTARLGKLTTDHIETYIANLEYHFRENTNDVYEAHIRYDEPELKSFFLNKWNEEKGHDKWARADLNKMEKKNLHTNRVVLPEMKELSKLIHNTMISDPILYISFMFYAEYMTSVLGPEWFQGINRSIGMKKNEITSLTNHIELDGDHASEILSFLRSINIDESYLIKIESFYKNLFEKYFNFFDSIIVKHEVTSNEKGIYCNKNSIEIST